MIYGVISVCKACIILLQNEFFAVQCRLAGPCALRNGESGQVGNEAATANLRECRSQGSPLYFSFKPSDFSLVPSG